MNSYYFSFNDYLRKRFGTKVRRISLNAGFSCPMRDGSLSVEGCLFCNEKGFSFFPESNLPLQKQIEDSMRYYGSRYGAKKFMAYFQNGTNTYGSIEDLKKAYDAIRSFPDIVALSISTRPDCIDEEKLDLIESYAEDYEVWVEYGLQTIHDATLFRIDRAHTFSQSLEAIEKTAKRKIKIGVHVILGLPGESRLDMRETAETIAELPISGVKLHVLHVLRDTRLSDICASGGIKLLGLEEYVEIVCDFLERIKPDCVVLRLVSDAKKEFLLSPDWINRKHRVIEEIKKEFMRRRTFQGAKYEDKKNMCVRQL